MKMIIIKLVNFHNVDLKGIISYLTEGKGEWMRKEYSNLPLPFDMTSLNHLVKLWIQYIRTRICASLK